MFGHILTPIDAIRSDFTAGSNFPVGISIGFLRRWMLLYPSSYYVSRVFFLSISQNIRNAHVEECNFARPISHRTKGQLTPTNKHNSVCVCVFFVENKQRNYFYPRKHKRFLRLFLSVSASRCHLVTPFIFYANKTREFSYSCSCWLNMMCCRGRILSVAGKSVCMDCSVDICMRVLQMSVRLSGYFHANDFECYC